MAELSVIPNLISERVFWSDSMRTLRFFLCSTAVVLLVSCAEPPRSQPSLQPIVEGKVQAVSSADIQAVIGASQRTSIHSSSPPQVDRVYVIDRNHIALHYRRSGSTEEFEVFIRTEGKWQGGRMILVGRNIPARLQ